MRRSFAFAVSAAAVAAVLAGAAYGSAAASTTLFILLPLGVATVLAAHAIVTRRSQIGGLCRQFVLLAVVAAAQLAIAVGVREAHVRVRLRGVLHRAGRRVHRRARSVGGAAARPSRARRRRLGPPGGYGAAFNAVRDDGYACVVKLIHGFLDPSAHELDRLQVMLEHLSLCSPIMWCPSWTPR